MLRIDGVTSEIEFENEFDHFVPCSEGTVDLAVGGKTNLFNNPSTKMSIRSAPIAWLSTRMENFAFGATIKADLTTTFDAVGLIVSSRNNWWAKFLHEMSPEKNRTVVSVISSPLSDDSNGPVAEFDSIRLRITNDGNAIAMHWAESDHWHLARFAPRPNNDPLSIGLLAHSSLGTGCRANVSSIFLHSNIPSNMRNGE